MKFADELMEIKMFLRDPDNIIWSNEDIRTYYNDALIELALKVGYIEKAHVYKYPPEWTWAYIHDWEKQYTNGDKYKCFMEWPASNKIITSVWETSYWLSNNDNYENGTRFTHPWESIYKAPSDIVPIPFHAKYSKMKHISFDERTLTPTTQQELGSMDCFYKTAAGTPVHYWKPDETSNQFIIYPRPSSAIWDDNSLKSTPFDSFNDTGGIIDWKEENIDEIDVGIITDSIDTDNNIFMVFDAMPNTATINYYDHVDMPEFLLKYVMFATLERCYGADNDGFIPSLRDYWKMRKEVGINAIKRFKNLRNSNRLYQMGNVSNVRHKHPFVSTSTIIQSP